MTTYNISNILEAASQAVSAARLGPGIYRRWLGEAAGQYKGGNEANPYGCADAANILYTLAEFPGDAEERAASVAELQRWQDPATGLFDEETHHTIHVTAHCTAALELFEARPAHPLKALHAYLGKEALADFLDNLAWVEGPWWASHEGAGLYAALVITGEADADWEDHYFDWLAKECDPATGFWRKGAIETADTEAGRPLFHHLAGSFHYLFNLEAARRPMPYPERMIDTCLRIFQEDSFPTLGRSLTFAEVDWIYCMNRARRQTTHRHAEATTALEAMAAIYIPWLEACVRTSDVPFEDIHALFGVVCALAELQVALPGKIRSARPLRLALDRRPFI